MKQEAFNHQFVEFIPEELEDGTLYVSMRFATVAHLCACGCRTKVVTPLKPTDWKLTFDGKTITLYPSIGNWSFPCKSHYWIMGDQVRWAGAMSPDMIAAVKARDRFDAVEFGKLRGGRARAIARRMLGLWNKTTRLIKTWWRG